MSESYAKRLNRIYCNYYEKLADNTNVEECLNNILFDAENKALKGECTLRIDNYKMETRCYFEVVKRLRGLGFVVDESKCLRWEFPK